MTNAESKILLTIESKVTKLNDDFTKWMVDYAGFKGRAYGLSAAFGLVFGMLGAILGGLASK